jgi:hypothetical protein
MFPYRTIVAEEGNISIHSSQESPGILQLIDQLEEIADKLLSGLVCLLPVLHIFTKFRHEKIRHNLQFN